MRPSCTTRSAVCGMPGLSTITTRELIMLPCGGRGVSVGGPVHVPSASLASFFASASVRSPTNTSAAFCGV